jgi:hypothetical protein
MPLSASFVSSSTSGTPHIASDHEASTVSSAQSTMMLKKPSILLSSYTGIHQYYTPHPHQRNPPPPSLPPGRLSQWRTYADVHPSSPPSHEHWPNCKHPTIPTPYEIFQQKKGSAYSKHRFYELVKIYHPDRHGLADSHCGGISHAVKLERYRLIIAANDLLSDPIRRGAYDMYGAGWTGRPEVGTEKPHYDPGEAKYSWNSEDSPFNNATWEDWERWYYRRDNKKNPHENQFYMSHTAFFSFIALIATLGGVAQATRVGTYSLTVEQRIQAVTLECSDLMNSRTGVVNDRQGRVQTFLRARDPSGNGLKEEEEEIYKTFLKPPGVSEGEGEAIETGSGDKTP